ncbi:MAG: hypothetical protein IKE65_10010, partial [Clostridia bacterium]|nr:hypothetical protein [Clostridia bacterium]
MKLKIISKRILSCVLCAVLLVSCWVFTAPTANAATAQSKYRVRLLICEDRVSAGEFDGSVHDYWGGLFSHKTEYTPGLVYTDNISQTNGVSKRNLTGTEMKNDLDANGNSNPNNNKDWTKYPYWCEWAQIIYKSNNATSNGTSKAVWFNVGDADAGGRHDLISSDGHDCGYFPGDDGIEIDGFPTSCTIRFYKTDNWNDDGFYAYLQVATWNGTSWEWSGNAGGNGTCPNTDTSIDGDYGQDGGLKNGIASCHPRVSKGAKEIKGTITVPASAYPRPTSNGSNSFANKTFAATGSVSSTTTAPAVTDVYGVTYKTANFSLTNAVSDYSSCTPSISGLKVTVPTQVATLNDNSQEITVTCCWASANSSGDRTYTKKFTVTDHQYTVTWNYMASSDTSDTGAVTQYTTNKTYYGDKATVPDNVGSDYTKYYTTAKHYTGGSFTGFADDIVTADVAKTMNGYTSADHTYNYSALADTDANYHSRHNCTCTCGYATTEDHNYGTTSFTFADNGQSATASRQCTKNGCRHIQSQTVTLGNGITSAVTTDETCTAVGTTTYTATSPFGDGATGTKAVNDRPALDHDWGAWSSHSGTEHIRSCQREGCDATETSAHTYPDDPSYTSNGDGRTNTHYYSCTTSGCTYQNTSTHTWDDGTVTTPATCTATGIKTYTCTAKGCTGTYTEVIPVKGHNTTGQPWVSTDPDKHWKECINGCGVRQEEGDHDFGAWSDNGDGTHSRTCGTCGHVETSSHGDTYNAVVTDPTCTAQGYTTYTCKTCPYSFRADYTDATGHHEAALNTDAIAYETNGTNHWKTCDWCNESVYKADGHW